jgi:sensor histidine kinase YesM
MSRGTTEEIVVPGRRKQAAERRSLRWIDPGFQRRYAILLIAIVLIISAILLGSFWYHSKYLLQSLADAGISNSHFLYSMIEQQMGSMLVSVCVVVAVFSALVFILSTYFSRRIVGPIFAIKKSLVHMQQGRFSEAELKLREGDEFQDVAELINSLNNKIQRSSL